MSYRSSILKISCRLIWTIFCCTYMIASPHLGKIRMKVPQRLWGFPVTQIRKWPSSICQMFPRLLLKISKSVWSTNKRDKCRMRTWRFLKVQIWSILQESISKTLSPTLVLKAPAFPHQECQRRLSKFSKTQVATKTTSPMRAAWYTIQILTLETAN